MFLQKVASACCFFPVQRARVSSTSRQAIHSQRYQVCQDLVWAICKSYVVPFQVHMMMSKISSMLLKTERFIVPLSSTVRLAAFPLPAIDAFRLCTLLLVHNFISLPPASRSPSLCRLHRLPNRRFSDPSLFLRSSRGTMRRVDEHQH